jgi:hypothetical protein
MHDVTSCKYSRAMGVLPYTFTRQLAEIQLRAVRKIGELSHRNDGKPTKTQTLAEAGISTSAAHRYEELAGPFIFPSQSCDAEKMPLCALSGWPGRQSRGAKSRTSLRIAVSLTPNFCASSR